MTNHIKRILWPDMIKGICMLLVIHSHIVVPHGIVYSFYAPVFLSAFFFLLPKANHQETRMWPPAERFVDR